MEIEPKKIILRPLLLVDTKTQLDVLKIRNEDEVKKWMYTDHKIGLDEHLNWINHLKTNNKNIVFVILNELNITLGVVSINEIDRLHKKAEWAYYLSKKSRGGLGSVIEFHFISFIFDFLGIDKLNCEIIDGNNSVINLHKKFLFKNEGFRRSNIIKNCNRVGVHYLGLKKEEWVEGRSLIYQKYNKIFDKFNIYIDWNNDNVYQNSGNLIDLKKSITTS